jgi:alkylhydroperoxidase family enzyme
MAMKPMYLPGVENAGEPSPYADLIGMCRGHGMAYPQIWHLFAFKPGATQYLERFTHEVMRGPSPLSPGFRELIAAVTSARNQCPF